MSDEQAKRVGLNESIFRQVNEQIEALNQNLGGDLRTMTAICECADGNCTDRIEITLGAYEKVRSDSRCYIIVPGHELPEFETVVESTDAYDVVRKHEGGPAELARELDPRS